MFNKKTNPTRLEKWMMAVTFAEAGEQDTALKMMGQEPDERQHKSVGQRRDKRTARRPVLRA